LVQSQHSDEEEEEETPKAPVEIKDEKGTPELSYHRTYDHDNY
jgi:hypothetical protein